MCYLLSCENKSEDVIEESYPIDTSAILEPKGTIHTGEGTFYGGGYEGGCAMLDPVSRDYWIVAMNLEDYADARLAGAYLEVTGECVVPYVNFKKLNQEMEEKQKNQKDICIIIIFQHIV